MTQICGPASALAHKGLGGRRGWLGQRLPADAALSDHGALRQYRSDESCDAEGHVWPGVLAAACWRVDDDCSSGGHLTVEDDLAEPPDQEAEGEPSLPTRIGMNGYEFKRRRQHGVRERGEEESDGGGACSFAWRSALSRRLGGAEFPVPTCSQSGKLWMETASLGAARRKFWTRYRPIKAALSAQSPYRVTTITFWFVEKSEVPNKIFVAVDAIK